LNEYHVCPKCGCELDIYYGTPCDGWTCPKCHCYWSNKALESEEEKMDMKEKVLLN